jgi:hypothetical protein
MRATIRHREALSRMLSASALERGDTVWYVVADDSPDLYCLDNSFQVVNTLRLVDTEHKRGERVAKQSKLDLEAMTLVERQGKRELLLFGSGSKRQTREFCFRVDITQAHAPRLIQMVSLSPLYDTMRNNSQIVATQQLNLEAAASTRDTLYLFQRGNISGHNSISAFDLNAFYAFLENSAPLPVPRVYAFALPQIQNRSAGFSAAFVLGRNEILFAASVEDTPDEIQDGPTLGSFIGVLQLEDTIEKGFGIPRWILPVQDAQGIADVKIEGIALKYRDDVSMQIYAITDNDTSESEILEIEIA